MDEETPHNERDSYFQLYEDLGKILPGCVAVILGVIGVVAAFFIWLLPWRSEGY